MKGDFSTPIKQTRHDEIGTLQSRFNTMRQNLGQVRSNETTFCPKCIS